MEATLTVLTEQALQEVVRRIVEVARPRQIILFGSAARGETGPHSDVDLLVVVEAPAHRRRLAQAIYRSLIGVGLAVDVIVVTTEDVDRYGKHPGLVIRPALTEGKIIYAS
ncbi:MAG: nucleotidyltransferase domain-containing protein [Caldilineales bacterium]|nr:nucleotidyltransferase domain-containing protein [Caldilineales bacterium]